MQNVLCTTQQNIKKLSTTLNSPNCFFDDPGNVVIMVLVLQQCRVMIMQHRKNSHL